MGGENKQELDERRRKLPRETAELLMSAANAHIRAKRFYDQAMPFYEETRIKVWQLRQLGVPLRTIALALGLSTGNVARLVEGYRKSKNKV